METIKHCRVNVMVSNLDNAIDFYTKKLELGLLNRYGNHYAEVQAPGLLIGLHPMTKNVSNGNNMSIGLGVVDFDKTIEKLKSKGIHFELEKGGFIRQAHFFDPDKNALFLAENKN